MEREREKGSMGLQTLKAVEALRPAGLSSGIISKRQSNVIQVDARSAPTVAPPEAAGCSTAASTQEPDTPELAAEEQPCTPEVEASSSGAPDEDAATAALMPIILKALNNPKSSLCKLLQKEIMTNLGSLPKEALAALKAGVATPEPSPSQGSAALQPSPPTHSSPAEAAAPKQSPQVQSSQAQGASYPSPSMHSSPAHGSAAPLPPSLVHTSSAAAAPTAQPTLLVHTAATPADVAPQPTPQLLRAPEQVDSRPVGAPLPPGIKYPQMPGQQSAMGRPGFPPQQGMPQQIGTAPAAAGTGQQLRPAPSAGNLVSSGQQTGLMRHIFGQPRWQPALSMQPRPPVGMVCAAAPAAPQGVSGAPCWRPPPQMHPRPETSPAAHPTTLPADMAADPVLDPQLSSSAQLGTTQPGTIAMPAIPRPAAPDAPLLAAQMAALVSTPQRVHRQTQGLVPTGQPGLAPPQQPTGVPPQAPVSTALQLPRPASQVPATSTSSPAASWSLPPAAYQQKVPVPEHLRGPPPPPRERQPPRPASTPMPHSSFQAQEREFEEREFQERIIEEIAARQSGPQFELRTSPPPPYGDGGATPAVHGPIEKARGVGGPGATGAPQLGAALAAPSTDTPPAVSDAKPCKCKKSRCLKLYCDCFSTGLFCNDLCLCQDCENRTDSLNAVFKARKFIMVKDPAAFKPKVTESMGGHVKGCACRKSRCLKKYCECFHASVRCSECCRCVACLNNGTELPTCPDEIARLMAAGPPPVVVGPATSHPPDPQDDTAEPHKAVGGDPAAQHSPQGERAPIAVALAGSPISSELAGLGRSDALDKLGVQRKLEPGKTQPIGLSSALPSRGEREGRERIPARRPGLPIWNSVGQQISNGRPTMAGALLQQNMSALMSALGKSRADSLKGEEAPDSSAAGALGKEEEALLGEEAARKERKKAKANLDGQPRRRRRRRSRRDFSTDDDTHEDLEDASDDYFEDSPPPKVARPRPPGLRPTVLPAGSKDISEGRQLGTKDTRTKDTGAAAEGAAAQVDMAPFPLPSSLALRAELAALAAPNDDGERDPRRARNLQPSFKEGSPDNAAWPQRSRRGAKRGRPSDGAAAASDDAFSPGGRAAAAATSSGSGDTTVRMRRAAAASQGEEEPGLKWGVRKRVVISRMPEAWKEQLGEQQMGVNSGPDLAGPIDSAMSQMSKRVLTEMQFGRNKRATLPAGKPAKGSPQQAGPPPEDAPRHKKAAQLEAGESDAAEVLLSFV